MIAVRRDRSTRQHNRQYIKTLGGISPGQVMCNIGFLVIGAIVFNTLSNVWDTAAASVSKPLWKAPSRLSSTYDQNSGMGIYS